MSGEGGSGRWYISYVLLICDALDWAFLVGG